MNKQQVLEMLQNLMTSMEEEREELEAIQEKMDEDELRDQEEYNWIVGQKKGLRSAIQCVERQIFHLNKKEF